MRKNIKILLPVFLTLGVLTALGLVLLTQDIAILHPKGTIAAQQRDLLVGTFLLSLVVIVPVFFLAFFIAWKYRASNTRATYRPDWDGHRGLELTWWAIPLIIIAILSVITWITSHSLDPYKPLDSSKQPLTVQVVALQWKWLFIYPEYNVATVNYLKIPKDTPINLQITADAPMNSFWIPRLGGQVYAMPGMTAKLHLIATETGTYPGSSANISGAGFAGMRFAAEAVDETQFQTWIKTSYASSDQLNKTAYDRLAQPSRDTPRTTYKLTEPSLYAAVIKKYMAHEGHP